MTNGKQFTPSNQFFINLSNITRNLLEVETNIVYNTLKYGQIYTLTKEIALQNQENDS